MENATSFDDARELLSSHDLIAPAYFILGKLLIYNKKSQPFCKQRIHLNLPSNVQSSDSYIPRMLS